MRTRACLFAVGAAFCSLGCQGGSSTVDPPGEGKASPSPPASAKPVARPDRGAIPESLRHDGYAYSGLERTEPTTYMFVQVAGGKPEPGTYTVTFEGVADGAAKFSTVRAGSLSALGSETIEVREDGVYLTGSSLGTPKEPILMLPAKMAVGDVWEDEYEMTSTGGVRIRHKGKSRVERAETVTIGGKTFETLLVAQGAEMMQGEEKSAVSSKTWYAKGQGAVRVKVEIKSQKGSIVTSTIEIAPEAVEPPPTDRR